MPVLPPGISAKTFSSALAEFERVVGPDWVFSKQEVWREKRVAIAGLTRYEPMFLLEMFAWDHRMRMVFRGVHTPQSHTLSGPEQAIRVAANLARGSEWPVAMAAAVTECVSGCAPVEQTVVTSRPVSSADDLVYSWVIAPGA